MPTPTQTTINNPLAELIREAADLEALLESKLSEIAHAANISPDAVYVRLLEIDLAAGQPPTPEQIAKFMEPKK